MDTEEIQKCMQKIHPKCKYHVYAANRLPVRVCPPFYGISNLDPDTKLGSHWVAMYVDNNGVGEYFDSYGRKPIGYHRAFFKRNAKILLHNGMRIQNDFTVVCGEYCLMYLYYKSRGKTMYDFVNNFSQNTLCNDLLLRNMFKSIFLS